MDWTISIPERDGLTWSWAPSTKPDSLLDAIASYVARLFLIGVFRLTVFVLRGNGFTPEQIMWRLNNRN
jgi:hypothetical protein